MRALASDGVVAGWVCLKLEPSQLLIACPAGNVQALFWLAVFLFTRVIPIRSTAASDVNGFTNAAMTWMSESGHATKGQNRAYTYL